MNKIFQILKRVLGPDLTNKIRPLGHGLKAYSASFTQGFPGRKLTVIGINGTKGKTSTTILAGRILNKAGIKTGYVSTAVLYDGEGDYKENEKQNKFKMTSIDAISLQKILQKMVKNGCTHVVLEMSSQGLEQHRHWGLGGFEIGVFLNAFPEHLEAHGGWDNYLKAKQILFSSIKSNGIFIGNGDDVSTPTMWEAVKNRRKTRKVIINKGKDYSITENNNGTYFLNFNSFTLKIPLNAEFEAQNTAFCLSLLSVIDHKKVEDVILRLDETDFSIPGRFQWVVKDGQIVTKKDDVRKYPFDIIVDYAHEPESMKQILETLKKLKYLGIYSQVIHILSCDGVGRDDWKKPIMGDISYEKADITICTTDNYERGDNPRDIIKSLSINFPKSTKGYKYFCSEKRTNAFTIAIDLAKSSAIENKGKVVIISTGVGNEYGLTQPDGILPWNEAEEWLKAIEKI